jgi:hypothetical protein
MNKISGSIDDFFGRKRLARWRVILLASLAAAIWGLASEVFFGLSVPQSQIGATVVGTALFATLLLWYVSRPSRRASANHDASNGVATRQASSSADEFVIEFPRRLFILAGTAAASILVLLVGTPVVEGAVLDRKLRELTSHVPMNLSAIQQAADVFDQARELRVKIHPRTMGIAQSALIRTAEEDPTHSEAISRAASAGLSASTIDIGLPTSVRREDVFHSLPDAAGSTWTFQAIATSTGPDNYQTIGVAYKPNIAEMYRLGNSQIEHDFGPAFFIVKGLTAALDGYRLKHVVLQNMNLTYRGGAISLEDVYFYNCLFQFSEIDLSSGLIVAIAKGGWVRFHSEEKTPSGR